MLDDKNTDEQETPQDESTPVQDAVEQTVEKVEEVAETVAETVSEKVEEAKEAVAEVVEETKEAVVETKEAVAEVVEETKEVVAETKEAVAEVVEEAKEVVAETTEAVAEVAKEAKSVVVKKRDNVEEDISKEDDDVEIDIIVPTGETGEAHDDFDWSMANRALDPYTSEERVAMMVDFDKSMSAIKEMEIVSGVVTAINGGDVVLDINFKSDGLISLSEFRDTPDLKVGDPVEVYVEQQEDSRGQLVLSRRKAKLLRAWDSIKDSYENGTIIKGTIVR